MSFENRQTIKTSPPTSSEHPPRNIFASSTSASNSLSESIEPQNPDTAQQQQQQLRTTQMQSQQPQLHQAFGGTQIQQQQSSTPSSLTTRQDPTQKMNNIRSLLNTETNHMKSPNQLQMTSTISTSPSIPPQQTGSVHVISQTLQFSSDQHFKPVSEIIKPQQQQQQSLHLLTEPLSIKSMQGVQFPTPELQQENFRSNLNEQVLQQQQQQQQLQQQQRKQLNNIRPVDETRPGMCFLIKSPPMQSAPTTTLTTTTTTAIITGNSASASPSQFVNSNADTNSNSQQLQPPPPQLSGLTQHMEEEVDQEEEEDQSNYEEDIEESKNCFTSKEEQTPKQVNSRAQNNNNNNQRVTHPLDVYQVAFWAPIFKFELSLPETSPEHIHLPFNMQTQPLSYQHQQIPTIIVQSLRVPPLIQSLSNSNNNSNQIPSKGKNDQVMVEETSGGSIESKGGDQIQNKSRMEIERMQVTAESSECNVRGQLKYLNAPGVNLKNRFKYRDPLVLDSWNVIEEATLLICMNRTELLSFQTLYYHGYSLAYNGFGDFAYAQLGQLFANIARRLFFRFDVCIGVVPAANHNSGNNSHTDQANTILNRMNYIWQEYTRIVGVLKSIFLYLDSNYVAKHSLEPIQVMGYRIFATTITHAIPDPLQKTVQAIVTLIDFNRNGFPISEPAIKKLVQMTITVGMKAKYVKGKAYYRTQQFELNEDLKIYDEQFEAKYLDAAERYFRNECASALTRFDVKEYVYFLKRRLESERIRADAILNSTSKSKVDSLFVTVYLKEHLESLLLLLPTASSTTTTANAMASWIQHGDLATLKKLHSMVYFDIDTYQIFQRVFQSIISSQCAELIRRTTCTPSDYITSIIDFRQKIFELQRVAFFDMLEPEQEAEVIKQTTKSIEEAINGTGSRVIDCLNSYVDEEFSKDQRGQLGYSMVVAAASGVAGSNNNSSNQKNEDNLACERFFDDFMDIFRLIRDKDIFGTIFNKLLSKRVLWSKHFDREAEKNLVSRLKVECGGLFTKKMETIVFDSEQSALLSAEYKQLLLAAAATASAAATSVNASNPTQSQSQTQLQQLQQTLMLRKSRALEINFQILTAECWPIEKSNFTLKVSSEFAAHIKQFETMYFAKFKGRKFTWLFHLGKSVVQAYFNNRSIKRDLFVSNIQLAILLLFNTKQIISLKDLPTLLSVPFEEYEHHLSPLMQMGIITIVKNSSDSNDIQINDQFESKHLRVVVAIAKKAANANSKANGNNMRSAEMSIEGPSESEILTGRRFVMESYLMKVMKSHRKLELNKLCIEVTKLSKQILFVPDRKFIEQCVNSLVERDYIRYSDNKSTIYYVV